MRAIRWSLAAALALATGALALSRPPAQYGPGCSAYTPSAMPLIAHAGGGLPHEIYANSRAALDLAAKHGFRLVELDFTEVDGRLVIWHEGFAKSDMSLADLAGWMRAHPDISVVLDFKTDALRGLAAIKRAAPGLEDRFIPELHNLDEFDEVRALGFDRQMLAIYHNRPGDTAWAKRADELPLFGVAIPIERIEQAKLTRHAVYLHTVNETLGGDYGVYTDCLVPA